MTTSPTTPQPVALLVKVPWGRANQQLHIHVELLDASLALNFPSLPLPPGRYQWRASIAETVEVESFTVRG